MSSILVLHGPNLNLLGSREPQVYGTTSLENINKGLENSAKACKCTVQCLQSNAEHELIDAIQQAHQQGIQGIIFNPGGFTHTSVALRDALLAVALPFIEVHLSNIYQREAIRQHSYFSDIALGVICGLGPVGYELALQALIEKLGKT